MRFDTKRFGAGLLSAGLALGWAGLARAEDKPADAPPPAGERQGRPEGGRRMEPGQLLERIQDAYGKLNLSDEQKTKVKSIIDDAKKDVAAAAKDLEGKEPRERMEKMREVMQPIREKLMDVLDETQREKLREQFQGQGGPGGRRGPGREAADTKAAEPGAKDEAAPGNGARRDGERRRRGPEGEQGAEGRRPQRDPADALHRLRDNLSKLQLNDDQKKKAETLIADTEKKLNDLRTESEKQVAETRGKFRAAMESQRDQLDSLLTDEQKQKLHELMPPPPPSGGEHRGEDHGKPKDPSASAQGQQ